MSLLLYFLKCSTMLVPDAQHSDLMFQTDQHGKSSYNMSPYKEAAQLFLDSPHCKFHSHDSLILQLAVRTSLSPELISHPHPQFPLQTPVCSLYLWLCFRRVMFVHLFWFLGSTYKWSHTAFFFFCLTYMLSQISRFHSLLHWSSISVYICMTSSLLKDTLAASMSRYCK